MKSLTESDTRAKLIDPALHKKCWTEDLIHREEPERGIDIIDGKARRRERGRIDYLLRLRVGINTQPIAVALIEAKKSNDPPDKGLEQAKKYGRFNHVPFVFSSNGHLFVEGFDVHVNPAGTYIVTKIEGKLGMVTVEEYSQMIASRLTEEIRSFDDFRSYWIDPQARKKLVEILPDGGQGLRLLRELMNRKDYDLYDVLAEIGYGIAPKSRAERVLALNYKYGDWLKSLPQKTKNTLRALTRQFERGGIEELENPYVFNAPEVTKDR
ncbi:MAG: hypothetical protein FJ241_05735 [Nitrospira sp.]|nr:hypothetical protein [Nitrospira sp.]